MLLKNKKNRKKCSNTTQKYHCFTTLEAFVSLFELLTCVSWHSHTGRLPGALPTMERIVSYSCHHNGQLSIGVFASFIFHLQTEGIYHEKGKHNLQQYNSSPIFTLCKIIYSFIISSIHPFIHSTTV